MEVTDNQSLKRKPKGPIKFNIQLNNEQKQSKDIILDNPITVLRGQAGSGKANWIETPILTPDGPKRMGDIKPDDYVISENGTPMKVIQIFPQGIKEIYTITFSDGSITQCTKDHLWNVISRENLHKKTNRNGNLNNNYKQYKTYSLEEIINKGLKIGKKDKWFIPLTKPVEFDNNYNLDLDPYIMGCLLGDGCLIGTPSITSTDDFIVNYFKEYFQKQDINVNPSYKNSITYYISYGKSKKIKYNNIIFDSVASLKDYLKISHGTYYKRLNNREIIAEEIKNPLIQILKKYNLNNNNSFNKHIPEEYLYSSIDNRISLLQGLLDTDGWVNQRKDSSTVYFCTTSPYLKDNIVYLVNSLGGICNVNEKLGKYKSKGDTRYKTTSINYRISISFNNHDIESRLFRLERKQSLVKLSKNIINRSISNIEYSFMDHAQCILVDSPTHLYLTDNFIVTHNTLVACQVALDMLFKRDVEKIVITRPTVAKEEIGFLPGNMKDKLDPWLAPIYANLYMLYNKDKINKLLEEGIIEILPFAFMRGRTLVDTFVIVDEAQNVTHTQMEMVIGRLGMNSKMVICGDVSQIDLKSKKESGFGFLGTVEANVKGFRIFTLKQNHRHPIVPNILEIYKNYND
jgi:phosphate starvation-inducible protein PhoH